MSFITRRGLSTLIPPKIASPSAIGGAPDAVRMKRVIGFYEKLPRGPAPKIEPKGPIARYQARHFCGDNASAKPIVHAIGLLLAVGYPIAYSLHLSHHKNNAH